MKAFLSIDYTNDFVSDDGALTTGIAGQAIEEKLVSLTKEFTQAGAFIVYAIDGHEKEDMYHPESQLFPPHNLIGTSGRALYGQLQQVYDETSDKSTVYWLDKRHYSAFSGTDLDIRLRERKITEIHLTGVCTDICVLHTAVDAYNLGYSLVIHKKAVASFDPLGHEWALAHFKQALNATIVE